ncbi:MAG: hypothetical protein PHQ40_07425 [Anaerolineaceae bacterium]|nr:hypothetical protein [Anaerolineaceae bacterium]
MKLVCTDSPVIDQVQQVESQGVELVRCKTFLDYYGLGDIVEACLGGVPDLIEALVKAGKVIALKC